MGREKFYRNYFEIYFNEIFILQLYRQFLASLFPRYHFPFLDNLCSYIKTYFDFNTWVGTFPVSNTLFFRRTQDI